MRETQELVTIVPWTFIATICNLFIQCWLIKKFLFKPIREVIEKRRALADSQIQDAKKAKEEAETMKAGYEAEMAKAKGVALQNGEKYVDFWAKDVEKYKSSGSALTDTSSSSTSDAKGEATSDANNSKKSDSTSSKNSSSSKKSNSKKSSKKN